MIIPRDPQCGKGLRVNLSSEEDGAQAEMGTETVGHKLEEMNAPPFPFTTSPFLLPPDFIVCSY
jgi:hypothetical protein